MTIDISLIDVSGRGRTDLGDLSGLAVSLKTLGSIHPPVLSRNADNTYKLIAGRRRIAAAVQAGFTELHHGSLLEPGKVGFLFVEEVPEDVLKEAELDENLYRLKPKWQEDVLLVADVHTLKKDKFGHHWGVRQTSELLGPGYGRTEVSKALRIAELLRKGDEEISSAENISHAYAILYKRKEEEALREMQRRVGTQAASLITTAILGSTSKTDSFLDVINRDNIKKPLPSVVPSATESSEPQALINVPLSSMFFNADCLELMSTWPEGSFDHVVTDIPYGIDMDNMDTRDMSSVEKEHDVKQNVEMMEPFLTQTFRLTKSGGFCVFFYDLDWHEYLQSTAEMVGWKVQRWPLIACKTSTCQNNAAQYNFTKNYECAMVLRRDTQTVLRNQQSTSYWLGDFSAERRLYNNPFTKPFELWRWIYNAIAFPGQTVLDPFCGEMSASRAAVNCGLIPYGIEKVEAHYLRGLEHMKAVFALAHKSNVQFT